jgi:acyl carrier protein
LPDKRSRLTSCFRAVFPDLAESDASRASTRTLGAWDSVASATLIAVVEEEFDFQFDVAEIEKLNSFDAFLKRLEAS